MANETLAYVEGFKPGFLGRIAQMHGEFYAKAWGSGVEFEALMARELCEFYERYDLDRDLLVTAHIDGVVAGSIAIDGTQAERPGFARIRWFLVDEDCQGRGIGRTLLNRAMDFCRNKQFPGVFLWTVEGLPRSLQMYRDLGFQVIQRSAGSQYGIALTHLVLEMPL